MLVTDLKPLVWIVDSAKAPLAESVSAFEECALIRYFAGDETRPEDEEPDAIVFSAEIEGGPGGETFRRLAERFERIPLLAAARVRSLTQAVSYFRAGVADYLALPLDQGEVEERLTAALDKAGASLPAIMVELDALSGDGETGAITLTIQDPDDGTVGSDEDILAQLAREDKAHEMPAPTDLPAAEPEATVNGGEETGTDSPVREEVRTGDFEQPVVVDSLPIPALWDELPCGLLVFDPEGDLLFSNALGMEFFGLADLDDLRGALANGRARFSARGANHKPLPDNQWPHVAAVKARAARSAVVSVERPDRTRLWLRMDCLPHLVDGKITRVSLTLVNMTGEMPPLAEKPARKKK